MKKFYTIALSLIACLTSMQAQTDPTFVFTQGEDGPALADGATIDISEVEEDAFGDKMISSGLYLKNVSSSAASFKLEVAITQLPSGYIMHCYPGQCVPKYNVETFVTDGSYGVLKAGMSGSLASEWYVGSYGKAVVSYRPMVYDVTFDDDMNPVYTFRAYGPTVTVNYNYNDPTGIDNAAAAGDVAGVTYYDMCGREVSKPAGGVFVKKTVDAGGNVTTCKVVVK